MSVNTKMTALADEVRTLSGGTGVLGIDAMTNAVKGGNDEIGSQTDLIAQISEALEGKAASGIGSGLPTQEKTKNVTENGTVEVVPDAGYTMSKVTVNVNVPDVPAVVEELNVTENGTYEPDDGVDGFSRVTVNVSAGTTETWTFTMEDGSEVTKDVVVT
jgi:hypothetical protein